MTAPASSGAQWQALAAPTVEFRGRELLIGARSVLIDEVSIDILIRVFAGPDKIVPCEGIEQVLLADVGSVNQALRSEASRGWCIAHFIGEGLVLSRDDRLHAPAATRSLPELHGRLIGREEAIQVLRKRLTQSRLVSIVGPGGIGKTSLAIGVARELADKLADGVHFVDLARHASPAAMARELAVTLGLEAQPGNMLPALLHKLRGQQLLIVLDCCEVAVDAAADLAEAITQSSPGVLLLATSREALSADDEWVYRIEPLGCPPEGATLPAWLFDSYPAFQLFAATVGSKDPAFHLQPDQALTASAICRRLDGNPLAIAMAASRVPSLGLEGVADQIDRAVLDWRAVPQVGVQTRHQSLEAVLDWSFRLLNPIEQRVFCSLALFRSNFELDAAAAVAGGSRNAATAVVLDLVAKSLLAVQSVAGEATYRLLDTTRSYAERALAQMPDAEVAACRLRHAAYLVHLLGASEQQWDAMPVGAWRRKYGSWGEDVREALHWAFSEGGNVQMGVELTAAALALADQTGFVNNFAQYAHQALGEAARMNPRRPEVEVRLHAFPIIKEMRTALNADQVVAALTTARDLGRSTGTAQAQLGCLLVLFARAFQSGNYRESINWSEQMRQLAEAHADAVADITATRTKAQHLHMLGDHAASKALALQVCARRDLKLPLAYMPSPVSLAVSMRLLLTRIHWIEGRSDQAWTLATDALRIAEDDHPMSVCQMLAMGCIPLAFWCGRIEEARHWVEMLRQWARNYDWPYWTSWAQVFAGMLDEGGAQGLPVAVQEAFRSEHQVALRDQALTMGPVDMLLDDVVRSSFARAAQGEVGWCAPEIYRIEALRRLASGESDAFLQARQLLAQGLQLAAAHGALAWELRLAMSAVVVERSAGDAAGALQQLALIRSRFVEGLDTRDLREADRLLA